MSQITVCQPAVDESMLLEGGISWPALQLIDRECPFRDHNGAYLEQKAI